jgi:hypothetical protein
VTPGLHPEIGAADYHADPCPTPSLSSGIAKLLVRASPMHAWEAHPRLGAAQRQATRAMEAGTILHRLILGRGEEFVAVDADDWRTKAARERAEEIRAGGTVPVLARELEQYEAAAAEIADQIRQHDDCAAFFDAGTSEAVITWREAGEWCRAMVDRLPASPVAPWFDLKTVARSAAPAEVERTFAREYAFQQAFYSRGGAAIGRPPRGFLFIFAEREPPFGVSVLTAAPSLRHVAEQEVARAIALWKRCRSAGEWPGYERRTAHVEAPSWMLHAAEMAEMEEELG